MAALREVLASPHAQFTLGMIAVAAVALLLAQAMNRRPF